MTGSATMSNVIELAALHRNRPERPEPRRDNRPTVVGIHKIDVDTIVETVRVLRLMDDQILLDHYNQRKRG
jgi:hypothetical protein